MHKLTTYLSAYSTLFVGMLLGGCQSTTSSHSDEACSFFDKAVPVWADGRAEEQNVYLTFRTLVKGRETSQTKVRLAASTDYRLTVNGEFVSHGPCVAAHDFYRVDVCDITSLLHSGDNVVAIEVAGYNVPSYYLLAQPSFLQAEVVADGKVIAATGDDSFTAYELKQRHDSRKLSFQRATAEEYTLTPDWRDCLTEVPWQGHSVKLVPQEEKSLLARGVDAPDYTIHAATALNDSLFHFRCNSSGFLGLVLHVNSACRLQACFDEILAPDGHVNHCRMFDASFALNLQPGDYAFESFEPYTMQFVEFKTLYGDVDVKYVYMRDYCGNGVDRAQFESDNVVLNRLFETARETHRQNALDIFMDCPSRERAGWLCDSYFSSRVAYDFSGHTRIEHNFLENFLLRDTFPDIPRGMLPMCYPSDHGNHNYIPNWAMWFVLELNEYMHRTGDRALIDQAKDHVYALVDFFRSYLNSDGLLEKLDMWVFVEWSDANSYVQDVNYPSNMLYARMLEVIASLYDDSALAEQAEQVRAVVRQQSYNGQFFCDNALRLEDGTLQLCADHHTEVCQYYAFYLKTATPETYPDLWKIVTDVFGPQRHTFNPYPDVAFANAFIGNYLRLELLSETGRKAQLLNECVAEYTKMANRTGTLWENMDTGASCNHGFAAHIAHVLLRDILGIADVDPANHAVTLHFSDTGLKHCKGILPVGDEEIRLEWFIVDGVCHYSLTLPKGYKVIVDEDSMPAVED